MRILLNAFKGRRSGEDRDHAHAHQGGGESQRVSLFNEKLEVWGNKCCSFSIQILATPAASGAG